MIMSSKMMALIKGNKMRATKSEMVKFTKDQLLDYVERTNAKYDKAPAFIKRTSFSNWSNNRSAIIREVLKR